MIGWKLTNGKKEEDNTHKKYNHNNMKMGWTIQKIVDYNGTIISGGKSIGGFGIAHHLLVRLHRVVICRPAALITCLRLLDRDCCLSGSSSSFPP